MVLLSQTFNTPLGKMMAFGDDNGLYFLEFTDLPRFEEKKALLAKKTNKLLLTGHTQSLDHLQEELELYFTGKLFTFTVPLILLGTPFQQRVWEELQTIPFGKTWSYSTLAAQVSNPSGCRAVAQANGANKLPIVIPCHRVIQSDGSIGGYSSGLSRKQWMLNHESILCQKVE